MYKVSPCRFLKIFMYIDLTVSADPLSPPTVEHLTAIGVLFPMPEKTFAFVYCVISWVTSKYPNAPNKTYT